MRKAKGLVPSEQLQRRSEGAVGFHPVREEQVPESRASQFLNKMSKFIPAATDAYTAELNRKVERDKLLQENRAALGMEPTDDATVAGARAHTLVDVRNKAILASNQLQEDAKTFEGTDDEWVQHTEQVQSQLFDTVGNDGDAIKVAGEVYNKEFGKAALNRYKAKQEQQQEQMYQTGVTSLQLATQGDYTPAEIRGNLSQALKELDMMGATTAIKRKVIVDAAIASAEQNDLTLIDYTKEMGLFQKEPGLITAERSAQSRITGQLSGKIAIAKQSVIDRMEADGSMTFEQWAMLAQGVKEVGGKSAFTETEIRSLWEQGQKKADDTFDVNTYFKQSMLRMNDEARSPVGMMVFDKKNVAQLVELYDTTFGAMEATEIAKTTDPSQQQAIKQKFAYSKARWLAENGIQDDKWSNEFKALESFSGELQEGTIPRGVAVALSRMDDLSESPGAIAAHATDKQIAIYEGFKAARAIGVPEPQAYAEAWRSAQQKPVELRGDDRKAFDKEVKKAVEASLKHNWLSRTFMGAPEKISEQQQGQISELVGARARMLLNANVDSDTAVNRAMAEFNDSHFQLASGAVVYGNRTNVARMMGVAADKVDELISMFPEQIVELAGNEGYESAVLNPSVPTEDWIPVLTSNGRITFNDKWGNRVTRIFDLSEVAGVSLAEKARLINEHQDKLREERIADEEKAKRTINQFGADASQWIINQ